MQTEVQELRQQFWNLLDSRPDLNVARVAAYTSLSRSGAEAFLSRRPDDAERPIGDKTIDEFRKVKTLIEAGEILQPSAKVLALQTSPDDAPRARNSKRRRDYYTTENSKRIAQVLDYCADQAAIGVVTADYGVGKSSAIQHWRSAKQGGLTTPNCYFEFDEFSRSSIKDFVARLAEVVGADTTASGSQTMRAIIRHLSLDPMLVILDQCETVTPRVLQLIRQIHDGAQHAGTGMVLFSSPLLAERLNNPRLKKEVGSLSSRVGVWVALGGAGRAEASAIIRQEGVTDIDPAAIDLLGRMTRGSMRRLMAVTDMLVSKHAGKRVTERTVEMVAENLWGMQMDPRRRSE
jgi:DNA transposition AAA+ family ATPase